MRRLLVVVLVLFGLVLAAGFYVAFQLAILQPPVTNVNFNERKRAQRYLETAAVPPISAYRSLPAGQARLYKNGSRGRTVVLLPDTGTGAWLFENYLGTLGGAHRLYAVSLRGMLGAEPAKTATFVDYLQDGRDAIKAARADSGARKVVLAGNGLGSLLALRLALERPAEIEALVLLSPYPTRERSAQQDWLAGLVGERIYRPVFASPAAARDFWRENFAAGFTLRDSSQRARARTDLAGRALAAYADKKVPFEYEPVIREVTLGRLAWLNAAYRTLEKTSFPVLQVSGRYDTANPEAAQWRLHGELKRDLGSRYSFAMLNSGKLIPLDWRWKESASALADYLLDLKLDTPTLETEESIDPATERSLENLPGN